MDYPQFLDPSGVGPAPAAGERGRGETQRRVQGHQSQVPLRRAAGHLHCREGGCQGCRSHRHGNTTSSSPPLHQLVLDPLFVSAPFGADGVTNLLKATVKVKLSRDRLETC